MELWYEPRLFNSRNILITRAVFVRVTGRVNIPYPVLNPSVLLDPWTTCCCLATESYRGCQPLCAPWLYYIHVDPVTYSIFYTMQWIVFVLFYFCGVFGFVFFVYSTFSHMYMAYSWCIGLYSNYYFMHFVLFCCWFLLEEPSPKFK